MKNVMKGVTLPTFNFAFSEKVYWAHRKNEMVGAIIYGEWGIGKSSYSIQLLREVYSHFPEFGDWKRYLVFRPQDFLALVNQLLEKWERVPLIVWDDAGLWLYALDWNDPKVKSVVKFLNVARTIMSGLVMTSPAIDMIVTKIPHIEGMNIGKITRRSYKTTDYRKLTMAKNIFTKWGKRFTKDWLEDDFNIMLPSDVYNYYKPLRDQYAMEAFELMRSAWFSDAIPGPTKAKIGPTTKS